MQKVRGVLAGGQLHASGLHQHVCPALCACGAPTAQHKRGKQLAQRRTSLEWMGAAGCGCRSACSSIHDSSAWSEPRLLLVRRSGTPAPPATAPPLPLLAPAGPPPTLGGDAAAATAAGAEAVWTAAGCCLVRCAAGCCSASLLSSSVQSRRARLPAAGGLRCTPPRSPAVAGAAPAGAADAARRFLVAGAPSTLGTGGDACCSAGASKSPPPPPGSPSSSSLSSTGYSTYSPGALNSAMQAEEERR